MVRVLLKNFVPENKNLFLGWFGDDKEGMKFLPAYSKPDEWIKLIDQERRFMFIAYIGLKPFGFFDFEIDRDRGHFTIYVSPEFRGIGLAKDILNKAFKLDIVNSVDILDVSVEEDNKLSVYLLKQAGFKESGKDKDGMVIYLKNKPFGVS